MEDYVFVCIGTNKLITDSLGPRVGEKLESHFREYPKIRVLGTMRSPVHFQNASLILKQLKKEKQENIILVDSALALNAPVGNTYISRGGIEIGKAYGKNFYFPGMINFKTVIGNKKEKANWNISNMEILAEKVASKIENVVKYCKVM